MSTATANKATSSNTTSCMVAPENPAAAAAPPSNSCGRDSAPPSIARVARGNFCSARLCSPYYSISCIDRGKCGVYSSVTNNPTRRSDMTSPTSSASSTPDNQRVLVTGVGGPSGRAATAALRARGFFVLGVDMNIVPSDANQFAQVPASLSASYPEMLRQLI